MATFKVNAISKEGFVYEFAGDYLTEYAQISNMLTDIDFGFLPLGAITVAPSGQPKTSGGALACQFCGKDVEPVEYGGKKYTSADVAASRAKKMGQMGRGEAKPVCSKCWTGGGHNKAWSAHYEANK